ncbi:hypothetical protein BH24ACT9_BH24ACT9_07160 [soil metagenome]
MTWEVARVTGVSVGRRIIGMAAAVLILSGCTTTVSGSAQPAPQPSGEQPEITTNPTPAPEVSDGTLVEAQRIAGATVLPEFIYPELTTSCFPTVPLIYPERMDGTVFAGDTASSIYTTYGFVAGWVTCRNSLDGDRNAVVFVAEMSDRDSATVAARELADQFIEVNAAEPTEIRGFQSLPAVQTVTVQDGEDRIVYGVFQAVGRMLAYFSYSDSDLDAAQDDVGELLEEQRELLGDFEPTPQDEVEDLDPDVYDLARRVADPPVPLDLYAGSYDLQGYLPGDQIFQRCYTREGSFLGGTDVFGVTDPADTTALRGYVQEQIRLMQAP